MIKAVDLSKGRAVIYEGEISIVHEARHVAKGNKRSYMQTKLKNLKTGTIFEVRFNVDDRLEVPFLESKEYEFLYRDGDKFVLMDQTTFDQIPVQADVVGDAAQWLTPNQHVTCQIHDGRLISFELPPTVVLSVSETPPVVKGATATNQPKDAVLETGVRVRVPAFIEPGERVCVDTRSGAYIERAK
jgi:elongation factor P